MEALHGAYLTTQQYPIFSSITSLCLDIQVAQMLFRAVLSLLNFPEGFAPENEDKRHSRSKKEVTCELRKNRWGILNGMPAAVGLSANTHGETIGKPWFMLTHRTLLAGRVSGVVNGPCVLLRLSIVSEQLSFVKCISWWCTADPAVQEECCLIVYISPERNLVG